MANKFIVTGEQYYSITGQLWEIQRQLRLKDGSPFDPELVKTALQNIIDQRFDNQAPIKPEYLELISGGEKMIIEASNGKEIIGRSKDTSKSYVDSNFKDYGLEKPGAATAKTQLDVYEIVKDATFVQMLDSLTSDWNKLVMSQAQIIIFCKKYKDWIRHEGHGTFFLVKKDAKRSATINNLFVVDVDMHSAGLSFDYFAELHFRVYHLDYSTIWHITHLYQFVVPQL